MLWVAMNAKKEINKMQSQGKKWYESLTIITNAVLALISLVPGVDAWIAGHPAVAAVIVAITNIGLRLKTSEPVK